MDQGYERERFESLSIKTSVAKKFRNYCKSISKSQSMALRLMVEFFEDNGVSPEDRLGETLASLKGQIIKRSNAVIAIIKNIEKMHHKPTTAILQTLFEQMSQIEPDENETFDFGEPKLLPENEELNHYKNAYYKTQEAYNDLKQETKGLLKKVKYVRNNFGIGHYRLNITNEALETIKQKLEHVHHHNTTETRR
ncbi:BfmA/BtgA family mobilization protein [Confluentibacter sediminis]|uniref:BfmA/BtgA family mobilization protein n=1 Tax=Confluentibacter sediminis TaxID=2219045 RepID=UPI0029372765|nr:BfmA/BtgA family mobilization protein [Confluentibacter sediminis]